MASRASSADFGRQPLRSSHPKAALRSCGGETSAPLMWAMLAMERPPMARRHWHVQRTRAMDWTGRNCRIVATLSAGRSSITQHLP